MIDRCPHCGKDDEGFYVPITEKFRLIYVFGSLDGSRSDDGHIVAGSYKCGSCHKTIPKRLIENENQNK